MSASPLVSVCIPAFNHERYVVACLRSVLDQSYQNFEIIVTDDCSTDGTANAIRSISDPRIKFSQSETNRGAGATANSNIERASGEYLCFLASDDLFEADKLLKQVAVLNNSSSIGAVFSYVRYVDEVGEFIADHHGYNWVEVENAPREVWLSRFLKQGNSLSSPTVMIPRGVLNAVGGFSHRLPQTQDFDLWVRICLKYEIHVVPERLLDYRVRDHQANASAMTPAKLSQVYWEMSKVFENYCTIEDVAFFDRVFPEVSGAEYRDCSIKEKLAIVSLNAAAPYIKVFGAELMYDLLDDPEISLRLNSMGYDLNRLSRAIAAADVFGHDATARGADMVHAAEERQRIASEQFQERIREGDERNRATEGELRFWRDRYERSFDARVRRMMGRLLKR